MMITIDDHGADRFWNIAVAHVLHIGYISNTRLRPEPVDNGVLYFIAIEFGGCDTVLVEINLVVSI